MRAVDTRRASPTTDGGPGAASVGRALAALIVTTLAYWLMNGAQVFETAVIVPAWSADPPTSLALLRGEHAPDLQTFWIVVHSLHELTFLAAVALCWRLTRVRNVLLLLLAVHVAVRVWTVVYFAAGIIAFGTGPLPAGPDPDLVAQVELSGAISTCCASPSSSPSR